MKLLKKMTAEIKRLGIKVCRLSQSEKSCTCSKSKTLSKKNHDKVRKTYPLEAILLQCWVWLHDYSNKTEWSEKKGLQIYSERENVFLAPLLLWTEIMQIVSNYIPPAIGQNTSVIACFTGHQSRLYWILWGSSRWSGLTRIKCVPC